MKQKILFLFFFILVSYGLHAQKENNNWLFGHKAGLTWNTTQNYAAVGVFGTASTTLSGIPTTIPSKMDTNEGCFSISDVDGNLLFYSDGITIWDKNGQPMSNANAATGTGMTGHPSSAQSGIIIPYPGQTNKYIAVTVGFNGTNNLAYSIVDMTLNGGLGNVVSGQKNIPFNGHSGLLGESLTAIWDVDGKNAWVVAVGRGTTGSHFNVWKIDEDGVHTTCHSTSSVARNATAAYAGGYIMFSRDGKSFAWVVVKESFMVYGSFDNALGTFTELKVRDATPYSNGACWGVAFSNSGKYLYIAGTPDWVGQTTGSYIEVFDFQSLLTAGTPNSVSPLRSINIPQSPANGSNGHFGVIMMGPDNRLYLPAYHSNSLYTIINPEDIPSSLNIYRLDGILGTGYVDWGLPTFMASWFKIEIIPPKNSEVCINTTSDYIIQVFGGYRFDEIKSIVVDWGDGTIDRMNPPATGSFTYNHTYDKRDIYIITVTPYEDVAETMPITERIKTAEVKVKSCLLPVNHNVSVMGYYD